MAAPPRPALLLLHGANASGARMAPLVEALSPFAEVDAPNLLGHGGRPLPEALSFEAMAADVVAHLDRVGTARTFLCGYSLGGYLALYLARHYPERWIGVIGLAVKYVFDEGTVRHWTYLAQPERLSRPGNPRAGEMASDHAPQDWVSVTRNTIRLFESLGRDPPLAESDIAAISVPTMLVSSNRDQIVPWSETLTLGRLIRGSHVAMFYGHAHPLHLVPVHPVARAMAAWMEKVEAPVRPHLV